VSQQIPVTGPSAPHLDPAEFRRQGHAVIDWLADYHARIESFPVRSQAAPGDIAAALPADPPPGGEDIEALLADLDRIVMPGITHWQHPSFFAYFPANTSGPAILGDLLSSGLGVQGMVWATSPAATEVETRTMDWLAELLDLPERFRSTGAGGGVINDTASTAVLTILVAALHRASGGRARMDGLDGRYTVYCSEQAHSSVAKAVTVAGVGSRQLRLIRTTTPGGPMDVAALAAAMASDAASGLVPAMVVSAVGTTGTGAIDPTGEIADVAARYGAWVHVDAAWAGVAAVAAEHRATLNAGLERVDSYATNPHKWLLTTFDCDAMYVADRAALTSALTQTPEYLRTAHSDAGTVIDYRDWHLQLGRRFRALKLWAVLRHYGADGLAAHIRSGVALTDRFARSIGADPRFRVTHHTLGLVCLHLNTGGGIEQDNRATGALMAAVNDSGVAYLSHTAVDGRTLLRVSVGAPATAERHIDALVATLAERADAAIAVTAGAGG
jgi:aromatic-L-amino-acid decarboxylase